MKLHNSNAEIFVPDGIPSDDALKRTTHLGFGAHQDDLEILAIHGILTCLKNPGYHFTGVTCTDGAGSPRTGRYATYTNEQMQEVRWQEQRIAASIGHYAAMAQLKYSSTIIKDPNDATVVEDFKAILSLAQPKVVYTHNLTDKHDTHIGVALKAIEALRSLPAERRPEKVYGVEIWRGLDWMPDQAKVILDVTGADHTAAALLDVYDSQIAGGKRYDLATMGRWRANATYFDSHGVDTTQLVAFAMDLTPLIADKSLDVVKYADGFVDQFKNDVANRLRKHAGR